MAIVFDRLALRFQNLRAASKDRFGLSGTCARRQATGSKPNASRSALFWHSAIGSNKSGTVDAESVNAGE
jgi:hypothetical protein